MNILVIGTIDNKGGAAQISWELRKRLKAEGHTVNTFVRYKYSQESDVFSIPRKRYQDWLVRLFANDLTFAGSNFIFNSQEYRDADIIHCHNLHSNFFNLKDLIRMSREKPVIWTLHDIWAITGFASDSITRRNPHPKRFLLWLWDNTSYLFRMKKKIYEKSKLSIVTVSDWLTHEVKESILKSQSVQRIYNGVDTEIFKPRNRVEMRKKLDLPTNKKIIAFGIKGWNDCQKIVEDYAGRDDVFFLAIGHTHTQTTNKNFRSVPYLENKIEIASYLGAADIFLYPTYGDTFGLIVAESMACGVPVVTYDTDALPEIVTHKETGYIAKYSSIDDMKAGIEYLLNLSKADYEKMSTRARQHIVTNFTLEKMYREYLTLYERVLQKKGQID